MINYITDQCFPKAFWQSTGSNEIIGEIIATSTPEITEGLHKLLCGEKITTYIDTSVIYPEIQNNPYTIYSFLLVAGYLKVAEIYLDVRSIFQSFVTWKCLKYWNIFMALKFVCVKHVVDISESHR